MSISGSVGITVFALSMLYVGHCATIPTSIDTLVDYSISAHNELIDHLEYYIDIYNSFSTLLEETNDIVVRNCTTMFNNMTAQINSTVKTVNGFDKDMAKCTDGKKTAYNASLMAFSSAQTNVTSSLGVIEEQAFNDVINEALIFFTITDDYFDHCIPTKPNPTVQEITKSTKCIDDLKLSTMKEIDGMPKGKIANLFDLYTDKILRMKDQVCGNLKMNLGKILTAFLTDVSKCVEKIGKNKMAAKVKPTKEWNGKYSKVTASLKKSIAAVKMM